MMKHLKSVLTLFCICAIVSIALAVCYGVTAPIILERQQQAAAGALLEVMPNGGTFTKVDISEYTLPATVKEAHKASNGGFVLQIEWAGFSAGNVTMVGVDADGKVTGTKTITVKDQGGDNGKDSQKEIPAMDANGHFVGADLDTIEGVDTVAGVTTSSKAYRAAVKDALAAATILGGGSYVSPEEMFQNNLNAALGVSGVEFDKHIMIEVLKGVHIYVAKNGAGHVVVINGNFIGVANGAVVAGVDDKTNTITVSDVDKTAAIEAAEIVKTTIFEKVDLSTYELPATVKEAHKASNGGYVFQVEFAGFNPGNVAMIGVGADGKVTGTKVITNTESSGYGADRLPELDANGHFNGTTLDSIDGVDTVAGCTVSTKAYRDAIKNALAAATILGGGSYRDPAQILSDNLNAALGLEGAEFTKHFMVEVLDGVTAIYVEKNGAGHVVVMGDKYIGVGADGNVVAGVDAETNAITVSDADKAAAEGAIVTIKATVITDIDMSAYDFSKRVKSVQVTDKGVYILETEGSGFGKKGDTHSGATGKYLRIRIAIAADGTILDCRTVYLNESTQNEGKYGDVAANEEFYGQFAGKDQSNYEDIIIAGATSTTDGYHGAIKNAYKAINIIKEGGAE